MKRSLVVCMVLLAVPAAMAQDSLSKRQIVDRSAEICRDLNEAVAPHVRKMNRADGRNGIVRHGRRFIRTSRPFVRDLGDLTPADGGRRYRKFVNNTDEALDLLEKALNALEARRDRLARRRVDESAEAAARAKRAAKRYGLRQSCISYVS